MPQHQGWKHLVPRLLVPLVFAAACAASTPPSKLGPEKEPAFQTADERSLACALLRDHVTNLFADEGAEKDGLPLSPHEKKQFRRAWAEELEKKGTFVRFERTCLAGLTLPRYLCAMASTTTGDLVSCMKLGGAPREPTQEVQASGTGNP